MNNWIKAVKNVVTGGNKGREGRGRGVVGGGGSEERREGGRGLDGCGNEKEVETNQRTWRRKRGREGGEGGPEVLEKRGTGKRMRKGEWVRGESERISWTR